MKKVLSVLITAALMLQLLVMFGAVSAEGATAMTVTSPSGTVGSTVKVEVGISNNPGFHALQCEIEYDETMLELVSIEGKIGKALTPEQMLEPDGFAHQFIPSMETESFVYFGVYFDDVQDAITGDKITGDVPVATLTFEMLATGNADVTVNCIASVALDDNYEEMVIIPTASGIGTVTIAEKPKYVLGDVNGDTIVDSDDAIYLLMYTVFSDDYPVNQDCDFDDNGIVDSDDAIYLLMHTVFSDDYPLN